MDRFTCTQVKDVVLAFKKTSLTKASSDDAAVTITHSGKRLADMVVMAPFVLAIIAGVVKLIEVWMGR